MSERTAAEILDVSLGGYSPSMRMALLKSASRPQGTKIPHGWTSNRLYAQLEVEGLVAEGADVIKGWQRQWLITDAGRRALSGEG